MKRRVLILGEHGQVARALVRAYAGRGDSFICAGRASLDITNLSLLASAIARFRPDLVINAGAYTQVDKAEDEAEQVLAINRDGALNAAATASAAGALLIHLSTDYVFDGTKVGPYVETDTTNPGGVYGQSKLAGEAAIARAARDYVIARTSWVYSADGTNFVRTMLRLAGEREEIGVVDDQWGCPTFAADLAAAIVTIGEQVLGAPDRAALAGLYHLAGSGATTWCGFARAIMARSAAKGGPSCRVRAIATADYPTRARRPANSRLDCTKAERTFGVRLPDWQDGLVRCLDQLLPAMQGAAT